MNFSDQKLPEKQIMGNEDPPIVKRVVRLAEGYYDEIEKRKGQVSIVRGTIIGALAGGHIDGPDGASYSKSVLLQIANLLDIKLPELP